MNLPLYTIDEYMSYGYDDIDICTNGELNVLTKLICPNDVVFDVGANVGDWSALVLSKSKDAVLYSFEPIPALFEMLKRREDLKGAALYNLGFYKENKQAIIIYYTSISGLSTLYLKRPDVEERFNLIPNNVKIQLYTLDSLCKEIGVNNIDFLKIDTEGAELDILIGAAELLKNHKIKFIQFEYSDCLLDACGSLKQIFTILTSCGYKMGRIFPLGIISCPVWKDILENYRYSNYLAF